MTLVLVNVQTGLWWAATMPGVRTIRLATINHAQAIRLPGHEFNSIQIDGIDSGGEPVRIILEPRVLNAMVKPPIEQATAFGIDSLPAQTKEGPR